MIVYAFSKCLPEIIIYLADELRQSKAGRSMLSSSSGIQSFSPFTWSRRELHRSKSNWFYAPNEQNGKKDVVKRRLIKRRKQTCGIVLKWPMSTHESAHTQKKWLLFLDDKFVSSNCTNSFFIRDFPLKCYLLLNCYSFSEFLIVMADMRCPHHSISFFFQLRNGSKLHANPNKASS